MVNGLWTVLYDRAQNQWVLDYHPSTEEQDAVEAWAEQCSLFGPPGDLGDDPDVEHDTEIAPYGTKASFYAIGGHERLIIVRWFLP